MHELSLVQSIFSSLEAELPPEELERVTEVELKIGLLSNVEPILLKNAFSAYQETNPQYKGIVLTSHTIPITIHCDTCDTESTVENYIFRCKQCGAPSNHILTGEELLIYRIHYDSVKETG